MRFLVHLYLNTERVHTPETWMKGISVHIKNMWIKQLCNHKVRDFATAFRVRKLFGAFKKRASGVNCEPLCACFRRNRKRESQDLQIDQIFVWSNWTLRHKTVKTRKHYRKYLLFLNFGIWSHFTAILTTVSTVVYNRCRETTWCL